MKEYNNGTNYHHHHHHHKTTYIVHSAPDTSTLCLKNNTLDF